MTENANDIVIVSGARTPQGKLLGALASQSAVDLGAHAIKHALQRAGVAPEDVDYVYMGNVVQAGGGQNPAKQAAVAAGLPMTVPAMSLNKVCLSGLVAVTEAARMIRAGEADVVVAGGMESMTNAPHLALGARKGKSYGDMTLADSLSHDGLVDVELQIPMGELTETGNTERSISREEQDEVAARSHQLAGRAQQNGVFADEIAPIEIPQRKGDPVTVSEDQGVRPDSTAEGLGKLRAAFTKDGTITAGNSSPISDGAAAMVLTTRGYAQEHGLDWLAVVGKPGQVAGPDTSLHSQPSRAIEHALSRAGWTADELDLIEINEAFAAVSVQSVRDLGVDMDKVNIHGGAIALGHPIGASGARLALHTAMELARRGSGKAAVSLCGGGGQGEALLLSR
ncbi:acetyl-CoA C-acetyltransferase [Kocuria rhizophila]|uniref:Probable acetyl-CoA acetyltransferase n=1 Tax=Kocuria rhizophila (strain ATCC 9341 / DSM 348 / NBRC 103217 / DC2201) TaxID=378753 RepID=B2GLD8_KOCRD|nr:acetyl-CoA C-acetyltransferase [Kocuria rhizophila]ASE11398.1 acetyl-CoA C-acetyltransferase [Kocuria rhizophila]MDV5998213.1 acetyl-CoA C-acetyltransferase [Kocuria rhizophila]BAG28583.1 acetyl-CoA acetyltransferase [Kocuria rhizophila DC2201]VEH76115.1 Probable acetyl-CoA acetyltransferase [Kocuria rhizophila]